VRCLVLGARRYDFKDDDGARVEGVTLHYLTLEGSEGSDSMGEIPLQVSAPPGVYHQLSQLPGSYDVDFRQRPGRGGKPTLTATGVSYLGAISLGDPENGSAE
jgi:hypothetical protein